MGRYTVNHLSDDELNKVIDWCLYHGEHSDYELAATCAAELRSRYRSTMPPFRAGTEDEWQASRKVPHGS